MKGDEQPNEIISAILCKPLHMKSLSSSLRTHSTHRGTFWSDICAKMNDADLGVKRTFLEKQIIKIKLYAVRRPW